MNRRFADEVLMPLSVDADYIPEGWTAQELADFSLLAQCAHAATADRDLLGMRLLRLTPYPERGPDAVLAPLGLDRMIVLTFTSSDGLFAVTFETLTVDMEAEMSPR